jgi:hypothetical protein
MSDLNKENARLGYETTIALMTHEGQLVWAGATAFAPLLILLLAGAVLERLPFVNDPRVLIGINLVASLIGAAASYVWLSASARSRRIHKYWIACARDFEAEIDGVKTLTGGKELTDGGSVDAGGMRHVLKFPERHSHTTSFNFLYIVCLSVFCALLVVQMVRFILLFK